MHALRRIQRKLQIDNICMPKLEGALENNQIILKNNYKEHFNKVRGRRLINYKGKIIQNNKEGKGRRI
jgi:hypothetical protein